MKIIILCGIVINFLIAKEDISIEVLKLKYKQVIMEQKVKIIELSNQLKEFENCVDKSKNEKELSFCGKKSIWLVF